MPFLLLVVFFFNDTATTEIYTLSLHDALPISAQLGVRVRVGAAGHPLGLHPRLDPPDLDHLLAGQAAVRVAHRVGDRKSTRLNSSHANISYAVFCLKKKKPSHGRAFSNVI